MSEPVPSWLDQVGVLLRNDLDWQVGLTPGEIDASVAWFKSRMAKAFVDGACDLNLYWLAWRTRFPGGGS